MTYRRCAAAVGAVAVGLFALSACSKPTPLATVTVGENSVHTEATCYKGGAELTASDVRSCLGRSGGATIRIKSFGDFHVGVEPAIADKGWFLFANGQPETSPMKDTYRTFGGSQLFQNGSTGQTDKSAALDVLESGNATTSDVIGVWQFKLELENSIPPPPPRACWW